MIKTRNFFNHSILLLSIFLASCGGKNTPENSKNQNKKDSTNTKNESELSVFNAGSTTVLDKNIRSIFQDKKGNYWFGSNGNGMYRYDEKTLTQFTVKDGLSNNQVLSIQEDNLGNIWFGTGVFGVSKFDGKVFTTYTKKESLKSSPNAWKIEPNDLWFYGGAGVYRSSGNSFDYLPFENAKKSQNSANELSRFGVYSILKDTKGNLWFGTQAQGVCKYNGKTFTWFTEKGLAESAVLALFEDRKGNVWFGNNGSGLYKYNGKSYINFTEEKGLGNPEFKISGKAGPGTLARVYTINEDNSGNLWIGTVDAGVWKYEGNKLINYTTKDGLTSNAVNTIYKDKKGELWFGTDADGICKFDGKTFTQFLIK